MHMPEISPLQQANFDKFKEQFRAALAEENGGDSTKAAIADIGEVK